MNSLPTDMIEICFTRDWEDFFSIENEIQTISIRLHSKDKYKEAILTELEKAYENWMYYACENSILISPEMHDNDLLQIPIGDYMLMWLDKLKIPYSPIKQHYLSGAKAMLPTVFDIKPISNIKTINRKGIESKANTCRTKKR